LYDIDTDDYKNDRRNGAIALPLDALEHVLREVVDSLFMGVMSNDKPRLGSWVAVQELVIKDILGPNEAALRNILGYFPTYMRPPYSSCSADTECGNELGERGYHM
jgi:peptidoglycan/xylan/chitin deacetylase (PgdA/CDA1 family)